MRAIRTTRERGSEGTRRGPWGRRATAGWTAVLGSGLGLVLALAPAAAARADGAVQIARSVAFADGAMVRPEVKSECQLDTRLPEFVKEYAEKNGTDVQLVDMPAKNGRVLELEISDTYETGNAWTGRSKGLEVQGRLLENGKLVGSFRGRRSTRGGAFGGYKGSCAFFGRCAKALGRDVADWLKAPSMNARLGE